MYHVIVAVGLSRPVYKIPGFSEMRGLQSGILPLIPYRYQFFLQQGCHIDGSFLRCRAEERPADMDCGTEIYFIIMPGSLLFDDCLVHQGLGEVVCDHPCPDLLLHIFRLICMEIAEPDSVFQLAEGCFDASAGKIQLLNAFRRKFIPWKVCDETFIGSIGNGKPDNAECYAVSVF